MAYYHASPVKDIKILEPRVSNHNVPLIYFSDKRENTLVYLSNAVEKTCREKDFPHTEVYYKWGPYGFDKEGKFRFEEYYPNALEDTYRGVSGYVYRADDITPYAGLDIQIPNAFITSKPVEVSGCEYVEDALEELLKAEKSGLISILRYDDFIKTRKDWLINVVKAEYEENESHPEYRFFLKTKFKGILEDV